MATILGNDGTALIPIKTTRTVESVGITIVEEFRCAKASADTLAAAYATLGDSYPTESDSILRKVDIDYGQQFATIKFNYLPKAKIGAGGDPVAEDLVIKTVSANAIEIPIAQHPDNTDGVLWKDSKPGVQSYLSPQPTLTFTWSEKDFVWTQANVVGNVGKREIPVGGDSQVLANATQANWLCIAQEVSQNGDDDVTITKTWQYTAATDGWDSDIYDDA